MSIFEEIGFMSTSLDTEDTSHRDTPAALEAIADVADYLQAGVSSEDALGGVLAAVRRDLDLSGARLWVRRREGDGLRPICPPGDTEPDPEMQARTETWMDAPDEGWDPLHGVLRISLGVGSESIGCIEAGIPEEESLPMRRRVLSIVAKLLTSWISSIELSEDLANEVAYRTRQLEAQRRFTTRIVDSLPVNLYVIDRDYRIQAWNRSREMGDMGVDRQEAIGRSVFDVLTRQPQALLKAEFDRVFATGTIEQMDVTSQGSGALRFYRVSKVPMRIDNDEVTHVITIAEDTTEQRQAHLQIAQNEKLAAVGQLAAGVMHEINNPLATIGACAEALSFNLEHVPEHARSNFEKYLGMMDSELDRCQAIVDGLLDFSNPKAQAKQFVAVNPIVENSLFLVKHHERFRGVEVVSSLGEGLPQIPANEKQITQVLLALMLNALDAMDKGGKLTIKTSINPNRGDEVLISLADTGHGISGEDISKIFEPFFTRKEPGRGTGLGLSICYGIVQNHGGRILVDSKPNQGATFLVFLPTKEIGVPVI